MKRALVISDLHVGTGHRKGQINIYDDFREDLRLKQLLETGEIMKSDASIHGNRHPARPQSDVE